VSLQGVLSLEELEKSLQESPIEIREMTRGLDRSHGMLTELVRLHIAVGILLLAVLPPIGFAWMLISYPGLMETPTIYPAGIPPPLIVIGSVVVWLLGTTPWIYASLVWQQLSQFRPLGSGEKAGTGVLVGAVFIFHYVGGMATLILLGVVLTSKVSSTTPHWQMVVASFGLFPAGAASLLWVCIGYPMSLYGVATSLTRKRREYESIKKVHDIEELFKGKREKQAQLSNRCRSALSRKSELQRELDRLTFSDPTNLGLKARELAKNAGPMSSAELTQHIQNADLELEQVRKDKEEATRKMGSIEKECQILTNRLQEAEHRLHDVEMIDPVNVGIKIRLLRRAWEELSRAELDAISTENEVGRLLKDIMLCRSQIEDRNTEITAIRRKMGDSATENVLLLRRDILELQQIKGMLEIDTAKLADIDAELSRLQTEYSQG